MSDDKDKEKDERARAFFQKAANNTLLVPEFTEGGSTPPSEKPPKPTDSDEPASDPAE